MHLFKSFVFEPFLLDNASNMTHKILYDNFNRKVLQTGSFIIPLKAGTQ